MHTFSGIIKREGIGEKGLMLCGHNRQSNQEQYYYIFIFLRFMLFSGLKTLHQDEKTITWFITLKCFENSYVYTFEIYQTI